MSGLLLKRLDIFGFKSFADRLSLEFSAGVTAVVGPNGSGKSNLTDSIRWVLGEQNARELRGTRMEDIIFSGSAGRRPLSIAEVSLTFDNTGDLLPLNFGEVTITRRVDREGVGTYLINRVETRLRDLHELFFDTGIGRAAYSVVGQGKIEEILNSRPEERRTLLEEVAGISKYRARKQTTFRKLEAVRNRMLRLGDVLSELDARLEPLRTEADKARDHERISASLTETEKQLFADRVAGIRDSRQELAARAASLEADLARVATRGAAAAGVLDRIKGDLDELEAEGEDLRNRLEASTARSERLGERREALGRRREELKADLEAAQAEAVAREDRLMQLGRNNEQHEQRASEVEQRIAGLRLALAAGQEHAEELDRQLAAANEALGHRREEQTAAARRLAGLEGEEQRLLQSAEDLEQQMEAATAEGKRLESDLQELTYKAARIAGQWDDLVRNLGEAGTAVELARAAEAGLREESGRLAREVAGLRETINGGRSRLQVLAEMEKEFEGYGPGVRALLRERRRENGSCAGIIGTVVEVIRAEPNHERALEAALGTAAQHLIAVDYQAAEGAIAFLKRTGRGRATFLPLDTVRGHRLSDRERALTTRPGAVGWAVDLVQFEERFRPVLVNLLGRILVAQDLQAARRLGQAGGFRFKIVTLNGEVLHAGGAVTGGSDTQRGNGLLTRRREKARLETELAVQAQRLADLQAEEGRTGSALEAAREETKRAAAAVHQLELAAARVENELNQCRRDMERLSAGIKTLQDQGERLAEERQQAEERLGVVRTERLGEGSRSAVLEQELAGLAAAAAASGDRRRALYDELTGLKVELSALEQEGKGLLGRERDLMRERDDLVRQLQARRHVAEQKQGQLEETDRLMADTERETGLNNEESARVRRLQGDWSRRRATLRGTRAAAEESLAKIRREQQGVDARLREHQLEGARLEEAESRLLEHFREQFGVAVLPGRRPGDESGVVLQTRVSRLRRQLESLGPVNPLAPGEYRRTRERYEFLSAHYRDLEESRATLDQIIVEMEKVMQSRFIRVFAQVRASFGKVFRDLFGGGSADLMLVGGNPLEAAVDIVAQPPGKNLTQLSLLSGGERALTAIAFMFSLLAVKPTPFCILDEIDAPLDEVNNRRFAEYLKRYSGSTQFILVTHQKLTMEAADTLYGITMQEPGISRLISVRLEEVS